MDEIDARGADRLRPKLLAVAYRMLGDATEAEDAVQDAYLRHHQHAGEVVDAEPWLVKTTTRICIDRLRRAKARREAYVGPWLPEPVPPTWPGAAPDRAELAESLSMAFLVLLETLSPAERAVHLLREVFGYDFEEIAGLLDKSPVNVRQIASRAKKRLDRREPRFRPDPGEADALAERFFAACREGDVQAVESMLAADVVLYADGGGKTFAAPRPVVGVHKIARLLTVAFRKLEAVGEASYAVVNGRPGLVFTLGGHAHEVATVAADPGGASVAAVYIVLNPDKLGLWPATSSSNQGDESSWNPD
ncbi:RNA polymerase sigma factor SigJ [Paludisphaera mucosa]|uniref:RNA polymerase sigma factor SigJ n=1 Tax=Paludisphaera mucosa TaxID=3030827 RepID=A0ABT6FKD8_9BACT|nr:RNA polymerase sigma factor SigJ [Paludisphaera mucosa]MDG3008048.1 RNA polymerase sigma factor SigJ [Paludisphaera mucosa]